jgi:hypothetical protein
MQRSRIEESLEFPQFRLQQTKDFVGIKNPLHRGYAGDKEY